MNQISLQNPSNKKIAYIQAGWHKDIVEQAYFAFRDGVATAGIQESQITLANVPGSLEIPLQAKLMAKTGQYDLIVACGLVVDGGIYRHDFVAASVIDGMMAVQLDSEVPILSVVLTPLRFHDHDEHQKFFFDHFNIKGKEAADACIQTLANLESLQELKEVA